MSIISDLHTLVQTGLTLQEAIDQIIPGADPTFWASKVANYDPTAPKPKRKKSTRRSRKSNKRTFQASQVLNQMSLSTADQQAEQRGGAMADLVNRVNSLMGVA